MSCCSDWRSALLDKRLAVKAFGVPFLCSAHWLFARSCALCCAPERRKRLAVNAFGVPQAVPLCALEGCSRLAVNALAVPYAVLCVISGCRP